MQEKEICRIVLLLGSWITTQSWLELSIASQVVQEAYQRVRQSNLLAKDWFSSFSVDLTLRTRLNMTIHVFSGT